MSITLKDQKDQSEPLTLEDLFNDYNGDLLTVNPILPLAVGNENW